METIPFDVNDDKFRKVFFDRILVKYIDDLTEDTKSLWGKMTPQNMIEHLIWAFEISTGTIETECNTPMNMLERVKKFLYDNRPMPREFKNPLLGEYPLPLRFQKFPDAKDALQKEVSHFVNYFSEKPGAIHVHPVFGPLGAEDWQRSHFKHSYHHLQQFGFISSGN